MEINNNNKKDNKTEKQSKYTSKKLIVKQIGSTNNQTKVHKKIITALGLGRIGRSNTLPNNGAVLGMLYKVAHLVKVEEDNN